MSDLPAMAGRRDASNDVRVIGTTDRWMLDGVQKQESKAKGERCPIFEDGSSFDAMFKLFHGRDGVVPLTEGQFSGGDTFGAVSAGAATHIPVTSCAVSRGLSFGSRGGPFTFDPFTARRQTPKKPEPKSDSPADGQTLHMSREWLTTGNCPVARSYRAFGVGGVPPAVNKAKGVRGPIFEDGSNFEAMFRLFHGRDGVVPLSEEQNSQPEVEETPMGTAKFNPMAACAASISLSFGHGLGPFNFDNFMARNVKKPVGRKQKPKKQEPQSESANNGQAHEMGSEWLSTGNCPIARSYRAVGGLLPLVAKVLTPPKNMKYVCPPAIVAARKALAKTSAVKALRPQALPTKVLAIGCLGMMLNIPLGMYREHTVKFSPQWILAVHATVPFIAMLRKAIVMPKYAMAFTIASAILGQAIGARAERARLLGSPKTVQNDDQGFGKGLPMATSGQSELGNYTTLPPAVAVC